MVTRKHHSHRRINFLKLVLFLLLIVASYALAAMIREHELSNENTVLAYLAVVVGGLLIYRIYDARNKNESFWKVFDLKE